nr:MAG TPA: hypothetical protein [Caudoviricetes sp.]
MLVTPKIRLATLQLLHRSMCLKAARLAAHARECLEQGLDEMPSADISNYEETMAGYRRYTRVMARF